jgi:class 3 adenylate cyclase
MISPIEIFRQLKLQSLPPTKEIARSIRHRSWITQQITKLLFMVLILVAVLGATTAYLKRETMKSVYDLYNRRVESMDRLFQIRRWYTFTMPATVHNYLRLKHSPLQTSEVVQTQKEIRSVLFRNMTDADSSMNLVIATLREQKELNVAHRMVIIVSDIKFILQELTDEQQMQILTQKGTNVKQEQEEIPLPLRSNIVEYDVQHLELFNLMMQGARDIIRHEEELDKIKNIVIGTGVGALFAVLILSSSTILRRIRRSFSTIQKAFQLSPLERKKILQPLAGHNDELSAIATIVNDTLNTVEEKNKQDDLRYRIASIGRRESSIPAITEEITRFLCEITGSASGALYMKHIRIDSHDPYLSLCATYGCPARESMRLTFYPGEGLIGGSYENKQIVRANIMGSSLSPVHKSAKHSTVQGDDVAFQALPTSIGNIVQPYYCAVPFVFQDDCLAVGEFTSAVPFSDEVSTLFEVLRDNVASVLSSAQAQQRITDLLQETQAQNAEIQLQNAEIIEQKYLIEQQKEQSEKLLGNILPRSIGQRLKTGDTVIADSYDAVSVLFADMVGFTKLSARIPAGELVQLLNWMFSEFDDASLRYGLEKIKTIGDCYMIAGGIPEVTNDHTVRMLFFAFNMLRSLESVREMTEVDVNLRIGIHCGSCVAGVIGKHKFAYDLWGDSVNTASRMESHGDPGKIHVSHAFIMTLLSAPKVESLSPHTYRMSLPEIDVPLTIMVEERGTITVKGKGEMQTYFIHRV